MAEKESILIVDDNENNRNMFKIYLEMEGYSVHFAEDGEQGLAIAREIMPDIILLDIIMPVMDGFQMIEKLRKDPYLSDIPVMVLTVKTAPDNVVKALRMGADDYLKKPFDVDELIARIHNLIKLKHNQDVLKSKTKKLKDFQKTLEFKLQIWTKEAILFQKQFEVALVNVSANTRSQSQIEQALKASEQAKNLINQVLSFNFRA
ncbi:MAG: response regulator [Desulfosalsimonadaceae bacterium]|nr:response regulator [Desulfosalsimonadaceae bacterium]